MGQYRLFFSWQSDRKDTKRIIKAALKTAKDKLLKDGIDLFVDEDTRERVGKRNIDAEVLEKIRKCDIFLADLTPVITCKPPKESHDLPKHLPNSNVMYEYGYALHAKGEKRMIVLASLSKEDDEHIEFMPFDINHDTITLFKDENSLSDLHKWIRKIIENVDLERSTFVPEHACTILFLTNQGYTDTITIHPRYKWINYLAKKPKATTSVENREHTLAELMSPPIKWAQPLVQKLNDVSAPFVTVNALNKTTKLSFAPISLIFVNQGNGALDNLHIRLNSSDPRVTFANTNVDEKLWIPVIHRSETDTIADKDGIFQKVTTLNPQSSFRFDEVFVHAPHDIGSFRLLWEMSSRSFKDNGELIINVEPEYEYDTIENDELAGTDKVVDFEVSE